MNFGKTQYIKIRKPNSIQEWYKEICVYVTWKLSLNEDKLLANLG